MITSKQIIQISEDYFKAQRFGANYVEVYRNPTKSELLILTEPSKEHTGKREIRFIANPETKEIFVCDAFVGLHPDMRRMLNIDFEDAPLLIYGEGKFNGSNFVAISCASRLSSIRNNINYKKEVETFFNFDWSWFNQYVTGIEIYVKSLKK